MKGLTSCVSSRQSHDATLALYDPDYADFLTITSRRTPANTFAHSAIVGFVHLDFLSKTAERVRCAVPQHGPDLLEHPPRGFISHARFPFDLLCRNAAASS